MVKKGIMNNDECILCTECADSCPHGAIRVTLGRPAVGRPTDAKGPHIPTNDR